MRRYTRNTRGYNTSTHSGRLRPILIILLVLLAAFLLLRFTGVGGLNEANFENQRNAKLRSEVQHAVSQVNTLKPDGSSDSASILGRVRQYVHGVEVVNDLNVSMYGEVGRLYEQSVFDNIYSIIAKYDAMLSSGQKTTESLNNLREAINALSDKTTALLSSGT